MQVSQFKKVAIGVVAENMELKDAKGGLNHTVRITPTEWLSMRDGELKDDPTPMTFKSQDAQGNETQGGFITNQTIPCQWLPAGSNRKTPPTVRRGMRVEIHQMGDQAKYYWRYLGLDDHLMMLETFIWGISAHTKEQKEGETTELTPDNMYWFEVSSHSKMVAMQTSKANGEPFAYDFYFDLGKGEVHLNDDVGNFFQMISQQHLLHLENQDGTYVKLERKDINAFAPQNINADAKKDITVTAGNNINVTAKNNLVCKGGLLASIDGGGSKMTLTAAGTVLETPDVEILTK